MSFNSATERDLALKKIVGKAHTSPDKEIANESLSSGLTISAQTVFGEAIPDTPSNSSFYTISDGTVEYLQLPVIFIAGTDTDSGRHSFAIKLPDDYETNTLNPKAGTPPFVNGQVLHETLGSIQMVPTSFGSGYEAIPYYENVSEGDERIYPLDERDWSLDYFNGVFFQQDPPGAGDHVQNPAYINAYVYIGDTLDAVINGLTLGGGSGATDGSFITIESEPGISKERKLSIGTGLTGIDGGENTTFQLSINETEVPLLTGASFTGAVTFNQGLSGSLTHLQDGSSYLVAGNDIQIQSGSSGQITISSIATAGNVGFVSATAGSQTLSANTSDSITFTAGAGMEVTGDPSTNTLTFTSTISGSVENQVVKTGNLKEEVLTASSPEVLLPFILSGDPHPADSVAVYVNGIRQAIGLDFTYTSLSKAITILSTPNENSHILSTYTEMISGVVSDTDPRLSDDRVASALRNTTGAVDISASDAPAPGEVLIAKNTSEATWADLVIFNEEPVGTKDSLNTDFDLGSIPLRESDLMLFVNGLLQKSGINNDFTLSGNTLTFDVPPADSDTILATYRPNYS